MINATGNTPEYINCICVSGSVWDSTGKRIDADKIGSFTAEDYQSLEKNGLVKKVKSEPASTKHNIAGKGKLSNA